MSRLRVFTARLANVFGRSRRDSELSEEIESHLEQLAAEHRRHGLSPADASAAARRDFGGLDQVKEQMREQRGFRWLDVLRQDVRYALRTLSRTPAFTLAAVSTLALGIGATTAIFSVANAALLRPLPYPHSEDLRTLRTTFTDGRVTSGLVGPLEISRLKDPSVPIVNVAMSARVDFTLLRDGAPVAVVVCRRRRSLLSALRLPLVIGRGFTPDYFRKNGPAGAIVSHRLWRGVFGGDPQIVGKTLTLTTGSVPILGVAAPEMDVPRGTDVWFNLQLDPQNTNHGFDGYLRLRPSTPDGDALAAAGGGGGGPRPRFSGT